MSGGGKAAAAGAALVAGLIVVVLLLAAAISPSGSGSAQATPTQLRAAAVPAAYRQALAAAGTRCAAAPAPILAAQLEAESGWNPSAVSPAHAQGMAQFLPGTWAPYGVDGNGDGRADPFDPFDAIATQAIYDCALAQQLAPSVASGQVTGGLTEVMLAAYNAGPDAVLRYHGVPPYDETTSYVQQILSRSVYYALAPPLTPTTFPQATPGGPAASAWGARIVAAAASQLGLPYAWGGGDAGGATRGIAQGAGTTGFDCSGLVLYAVAQASGGSIQLPHSADLQTRTGTPVTPGQLQPGDLISFTDPGAAAAHHIGIYVGADQMIHAPETGGVVEIITLDSSYWKAQQWRAVRLG